MEDYEKKAFLERVRHEFGCSIEFEENKDEDNNQEDIVINGYMPDQAFKLLNEHPLLQTEISIENGLYPPTWDTIKETREKETEGKFFKNIEKSLYIFSLKDYLRNF